MYRPGTFQAASTLLVAATALTIVVALPVLARPGERIFGTETAGRHHDPFTVMQQFAGARLVSPYLQPATDWTGRVLAKIVTPVTTYNILVLLTFPLAAWFTFLFAYEVKGTTLGSALAAFAFAFAPFHVAQAAYHIHIAQVQWIPLYFLALWRSVHRASIGRAIAVVASGAIAVLASDYSALLLAAMTPFAVLLFWLAAARDGEPPATRNIGSTVAVLLAAAGAGLLWLAYAIPVLFVRPSAFAVSRYELSQFSARWWSYLIPPVDHPLLGRWAGRIWMNDGVGAGLVEQQVYVGWSLLALASVALAEWWRVRDEPRRAYVPSLVALAGLAALCSLSPDSGVGSLATIAPAALLYRIAPMFRAYARFAVLVQLFTSVLAGAGLAALWKNPRALTRAAAVLLLAALAVEYAPIQRWRDVLPTTAHRWLARHGGGQPAFDCSAETLAEQATSWLAGYTIGYLQPAVSDCGEPELATKLNALTYRYLVVRHDGKDGQWLAAHRRRGLEVVYRAADAEVMAIEADDRRIYIAESDGLFSREYGAERTWRWMGRQATMVMVNAGATRRTAALGLELAAFARPRHVTVSLDGAPISALTASPVPAVFEVGPLALSPGRHELTIRSVEPPIKAAPLEGGTDTRPLALALGDWRWIDAR